MQSKGQHALGWHSAARIKGQPPATKQSGCSNPGACQGSGA
jgi:hypothetical protein